MSPIIERGSHADLIRQELRAAFRRPAFWVFAAREAIPVAGVFFLGWEPIYAGAFFVLESWIYMSSRVAAEEVYDQKTSRLPEDAGALKKLQLFAGYMLAAFLVYGLVVGVLGLMGLFWAFGEQTVETFLGEAWLRPTFLAGLAVLLLTELHATWLFARGASARDEEQREYDKVKIKAMFHRCFALVCCTVIFGFLVKLTGGKAFVLIPYFVVLYFEACPREVRRMVGRYGR